MSEDLARYRKSILSGIDALPVTRRGDPAHYAFISEPCWFYFPRFGKEDRRHGVPNPIAHLLLSRALADNYVDLRRKARRSKFTLSPPVFDWSGSRALMRSNVELRDDFRVNLSSRREEYVAADVRAFFHSIYTHAIPWAIHGKSFAKRNRTPTHYGNLIDLLCRNAQDGQTLGLPVGPDTSRLIAEVVASAIDETIEQRLGLGARDASRYIDDYTLSSPNGADGEELLAALRQSVALFELELNSGKSGIFPTSYRQTTGWQQAARAHLPSSSSSGNSIEAVRLQHFLYQLGLVCEAHPDINVEKYGLQYARSALVNADNWKTLLFSLINAYRRNPSLVSLLVEACLLRQAAHGDVQVEVLVEFIENRVPVLARANRTGEIIWFLFLSIRLNLTLSSLRLMPLYSIENSFIGLLVVCMDSRGLIVGAVDRSVWDRSLSADGLRSPMWFYAYEAVTQGYIPGANDSFITQDTYFQFLRRRRVQFLDMTRGYSSIASTLRGLRNENERWRRLREALIDEDFDDLDEDEEYDIFDDMDVY
ncbi:RNA-directed DNA polymerase [Tianweitania populi]|uniref:RNA-directed DNA polymerase n=1 Tax=Tianweitania populi TaxID=1607949 RepID=UPI0036DF6FEC